MKLFKPYLKRIALDTGIIDGTRKYVKYILLSRSRTGSEYLRSLLNSHSKIIAFGELFQNPDSIDWDFPGFYKTKKKRALFQKAPVLFLENEIFRIYPKQIKAIGFKIFYYHAQTEPWKEVWTYLQNLRDIKIVHLKRKNILKTHLSRKRAIESGKWINIKGEKESFKPISLDYEECLDDFIKTRQWEDEYDIYFGKHHKLDIYYGNLSNDRQKNELRRIQQFLGVQEEELQSITFKQRTQPISEVIANYRQLKESFKDTPWAEFFEE